MRGTISSFVPVTLLQAQEGGESAIAPDTVSNEQ
jgi:hypothetical protein